MTMTVSDAGLPVFFANIRPIFGGELNQQQVDGINALLAAWEKSGDKNPRHLAYVLATAKHETAHTMQPVRETLASTDAKAKERLTKAWKAGKMPSVKRDYWSSGYFGRGYVQLTHKANYEKAGKALGVDLVGNPSLALDPEIAGRVLIRGMLEGWFTGKKLSDYPSDFMGARAIVNGSDRASAIAGYAYRFLDAIERAAQPAPQPAKPIPAPTPAPAPSRPATGFWQAVVAFLLSLFGKKQD